jgi:predicted cobalt transporter CbtA
MQSIVHYSLHFLAPGLIAWLFFRQHWKRAWLIMLGTMLVDVDHLLANPIFDPNRCGIGYHPLHSYYAIAVYFGMLFFPKTRIIAVGLVFHMLTDFQDCFWM